MDTEPIQAVKRMQDGQDNLGPTPKALSFQKEHGDTLKEKIINSTGDRVDLGPYDVQGTAAFMWKLQLRGQDCKCDCGSNACASGGGGGHGGVTTIEAAKRKIQGLPQQAEHAEEGAGHQEWEVEGQGGPGGKVRPGAG